MRILRGIGTCKPDKREALIQAGHKLVQTARAEEGIVEFAMYQGMEDPNTFVLIEVYRDAATQEKHNNQPYVAEFSSCLGDCLAAPPDVKIMDGDWITVE